MATRVSIATKKVADDLSGASISFTNGDVVEAKLDELSPEIQTRLALHGLMQKLGDSYAGVKDDVAVAAARAKNVLQNLMAGDWTKAATGGGGGVSDLVKALSEITGEAIELCVEIVDSLSKKDKAELRNQQQVAVILARYAQERAEAKLAKLRESGGDAKAPFDLGALMEKAAAVEEDTDPAE